MLELLEDLEDNDFDVTNRGTSTIQKVDFNSVKYVYEGEDVRNLITLLFDLENKILTNKQYKELSYTYQRVGNDIDKITVSFSFYNNIQNTLEIRFFYKDFLFRLFERNFFKDEIFDVANLLGLDAREQVNKFRREHNYDEEI